MLTWLRANLMTFATLALAVLLGLQTWRLHTEQLAHQKLITLVAQERLDRVTDALQAETDARNEEIAHNARLQEAQDAAAAKEITLRHDAAGARHELAGVRDELASTRAQLADATRSSLVERAAAVHDVFEQCASRYSELAEKADRHALDAEKFWRAWPVTSGK